MKFRDLLEHLARIKELSHQIEELRAPYVDSEGQAMLPPEVHKQVQEARKILETYLNCDVEQPSKWPPNPKP